MAPFVNITVSLKPLLKLGVNKSALTLKPFLLGRVVGGSDVTSPSEFPFFVTISSSYGGFPWCGGTILDAYTILTAAHCTQPKYIKAGSTNRMGTDGIIKEIASCKSHPSAKVTSSGCWTMDLQICRLKQPIPLGKNNL